jgi:hypothetical protein
MLIVRMKNSRTTHLDPEGGDAVIKDLGLGVDPTTMATMVVLRRSSRPGYILYGYNMGPNLWLGDKTKGTVVLDLS